MFSIRIRFISWLVLLLAALTCPAFCMDPDVLRIGTAKVDITPADPGGLTNLWEVKYTAVHDNIYARAIVLGNDVTMATIIEIDAVEITDGTALVQAISKEVGIPTSNIILAATHNHNAPLFSLQNASGSRKAGPAASEWIKKVQGDLISALKQAKANMQPAAISVGSGMTDINVNRDQLLPDGRYDVGRNSNGPSDKTVWVVKFTTPAGEPIAILVNYAVHNTVVNLKGSLLTAELAGATSRYVETYYGDKVFAMWTMGAAGDQAPILMSQKPNDPIDLEDVDVLGQILGQEVVRVADGMKTSNASPRIWGAEKTVTCPGQKTIGKSQEGPNRKLVDADPVSFRLGVLMIGKIAITAVSAEVVSNIYQRLRKESPFTDTLMITIANGRIGYIPEDRSYDNPTFEVFGSPLKKGCGESTIVNGLVEMMGRY